MAIAVASLGACVGEDPNGGARELRSTAQAAAHPGPWVIPADVRAAGEAQYVPYDGAPLWDGGASCAGGLMPGAQELGAYLLAHFGGPCQIQGYNCRRNTADPSRMSVHGTGRAIDVIIPTVGGSSACFDAGGEADNDKGDPVGNWLIEHAEEIGVQYIIWDWWTWAGYRSGRKDRLYCNMDASRCHPHHNHLHVELTIAGANRETPWFTERCSDGSCDTEDDPEPACVPEPVAGAEDEVFADVAPTTFGYTAINLLWDAGITNGCQSSPRMYCPSCDIDRYAFVVFLLRAAAIDTSDPPATPAFADVAPSDWFYPYVEAAAREGITTGCGGGNFCPHDPVTRGQAAAFITRTLGWPLSSPASPTFADVSLDYLFYSAIETISDWCVTNGCGGGNYCPEDALTRAQAAIFVARAFDLEGYNACIEACDADACAAQAWCEPWGDCAGFADVCGETGTAARTCHEFACEGTIQVQLCEETLVSETQACQRDTDGVEVAGWSAWSGCDREAEDEHRDRTLCADGETQLERQARPCPAEPADPAPDAGPETDAGSAEDLGGVEVLGDGASTEPDEDEPELPSSSEDAGSDGLLTADPGQRLPEVQPESDGGDASSAQLEAGCACTVTHSRSEGPALALGLALVLLWWRRRGRASY